MKKMNMKIFIINLIGCLIFLFPTVGLTETLGSYSILQYLTHPYIEDVTFYFGVDERIMENIHDNSISNLAILFELPLSSIEIGDTFTVNSGDEFDAAVSLLTNGLDNTVRTIISGSIQSTGSSQRERDFFWNDNSWPTNEPVRDLRAYSINFFTLTIEDIYRNQFYTHDDWNGYDLYANMVAASLSVDVTRIIPPPWAVPEPATMLLLGLGLVGVLGIRRKMRK